jgi:hypothetical protein
MSIIIVNPFNQLVRFTKGFISENNFSEKFLDFLYEFITKNQPSKRDKIEFFHEREKNKIIQIFNENKEKTIKQISYFYLENFLETNFLNKFENNEMYFNKNLSDELIELIRKEIVFTPYVVEKFFSFFFNHLSDKEKIIFLFQNELDKFVFNIIFNIIDSESYISENLNGK